MLGSISNLGSQYVIGPEDSLYIHVWKEETLSRTVPVRIDGKISLPLIDEIGELILEDRYYQALKATRKLIAYEEELVRNAHERSTDLR